MKKLTKKEFAICDENLEGLEKTPIKVAEVVEEFLRKDLGEEYYKVVMENLLTMDVSTQIQKQKDCWVNFVEIIIEYKVVSE